MSGTSHDTHHRLPDRLLFILPGERGLADTARLAEAYWRGGGRWLQLRGVCADGGPLLGLVKSLLAGMPAGAVLSISDRLDLALAARDQQVSVGLHLKESSPTTALIRRYWDGLLGRSLHAATHLTREQQAGVDYVLLAPILPPNSKPSATVPLGFLKLQMFCKVAGLPVVALGGLGAKDAPLALQAGASAVAVIGAIADAPDPAEATRRLRESVAG